MGLSEALNVLTKGGRLAVVSFHSLEDDIVAQFMNKQAKSKKIRVLTKTPIIPTKDEIKENLRSRSAILRVAEVI